MIMRAWLLIGSLLLLWTGGAAADAASDFSFGFNWAKTESGELSIEKSPSRTEEVKLDGATLFKSDDEHYSWHVVAAYPTKGMARLVLLESDNGNNYCPAHHRVLEVKAGGATIWTSDFGECAVHEASNMTSEREIIALNNPLYADGEWKIGLKVRDSKSSQARRIWFIYKNGRVLENGKIVASPLNR
ncbi:hypothetical protein [Ideonella sp. YS5]|uniref:hypothetical protein n=1 Tax=Ideonella sp. YS5 TaxID=3453714 RepID=UPI003EE9ACA5